MTRVDLTCCEGKLCRVTWLEAGSFPHAETGILSIGSFGNIHVKTELGYYSFNVAWLEEVQVLGGRKAAIAAAKRKRENGNNSR